jgi:hypothetical protein
MIRSCLNPFLVNVPQRDLVTIAHLKFRGYGVFYSTLCTVKEIMSIVLDRNHSLIPFPGMEIAPTLPVIESSLRWVLTPNSVLDPVPIVWPVYDNEEAYMSVASTGTCVYMKGSGWGNAVFMMNDQCSKPVGAMCEYQRSKREFSSVAKVPQLEMFQ